MESPVFEYELTILEQHLDTFGHVNNAAYLEIFEEARWDLITKNGYGLKEIFEKQIGPTILEVTLRYRKEILNREKIKILTKCSEYNRKIGKIEQRILNENGEECTTATFLFGLFDMKERKLIDATPEWKKAIGLT